MPFARCPSPRAWSWSEHYSLERGQRRARCRLRRRSGLARQFWLALPRRILVTGRFTGRISTFGPLHHTSCETGDEGTNLADAGVVVLLGGLLVLHLNQIVRSRLPEDAATPQVGGHLL